MALSSHIVTVLICLLRVDGIDSNHRNVPFRKNKAFCKNSYRAETDLINAGDSQTYDQQYDPTRAINFDFCKRTIKVCNACHVSVTISNIKIDTYLDGILCNQTLQDWINSQTSINKDWCFNRCLYMYIYDKTYQHTTYIYFTKEQREAGIKLYKTSISPLMNIRLCWHKNPVNYIRMLQSIEFTVTVKVLGNNATVVLLKPSDIITSSRPGTDAHNPSKVLQTREVIMSPNYRHGDYELDGTIFNNTIDLRPDIEENRQFIGYTYIVLDFVDWVLANQSWFMFQNANIVNASGADPRPFVKSKSNWIKIIFHTGIQKEPAPPFRFFAISEKVYRDEPFQTYKRWNELLPFQIPYSGFISIQPKEDHALNNVYVIPDSRRRGYNLIIHLKMVTFKFTKTVHQGDYVIEIRKNMSGLHRKKTRFRDGNKMDRQSSYSGFRIVLRGEFSRGDVVNMSYTYASPKGSTRFYQNFDYLCDNGERISSHLKCDGFPHCIDGSDEGSANCVAKERKGPWDFIIRVIIPSALGFLVPATTAMIAYTVWQHRKKRRRRLAQQQQLEQRRQQQREQRERERTNRNAIDGELEPLIIEGQAITGDDQEEEVGPPPTYEEAIGQERNRRNHFTFMLRPPAYDSLDHDGARPSYSASMLHAQPVQQPVVEETETGPPEMRRSQSDTTANHSQTSSQAGLGTERLREIDEGALLNTEMTSAQDTGSGQRRGSTPTLRSSGTPPSPSRRPSLYREGARTQPRSRRTSSINASRHLLSSDSHTHFLNSLYQAGLSEETINQLGPRPNHSLLDEIVSALGQRRSRVGHAQSREVHPASQGVNGESQDVNRVPQAASTSHSSADDIPSLINIDENDQESPDAQNNDPHNNSDHKQNDENGEPSTENVQSQENMDAATTESNSNNSNLTSNLRNTEEQSTDRITNQGNNEHSKVNMLKQKNAVLAITKLDSNNNSMLYSGEKRQCPDHMQNQGYATVHHQIQT